MLLAADLVPTGIGAVDSIRGKYPVGTAYTRCRLSESFELHFYGSPGIEANATPRPIFNNERGARPDTLRRRTPLRLNG